MCASLSISGPPLTLSNVLEHVQGVHWRKLWEMLFYWDRVDLLKAIQTENTSDQDRLHTVLEHWLTGRGRPPSWRMLAYSLNKEGELTVADSIREFAEPPRGEFHCSYCLQLCSSHTYNFGFSTFGEFENAVIQLNLHSVLICNEWMCMGA